MGGNKWYLTHLIQFSRPDIAFEPRQVTVFLSPWNWSSNWRNKANVFMCECSAKTAAIYSKKIIRRQQFFEEIAAGDCNTFVSVTPWETAVIGVSFSDTYGSEGARSVSRQVSSFWRLDGKVTRSRLWRKPEPKLKLWRLDGKVTRSRLWLTPQPQLKLWRLDGKVTCSRLWLKFSPKLRLLTS